jgi:hypothetical protein
MISGVLYRIFALPLCKREKTCGIDRRIFRPAVFTWIVSLLNGECLPGDSGSPCIIKHGNSIYAVAMIVAGSTGSLWSRRNEGREVPEGIVLERDILEKVTAALNTGSRF